MSSNNNVLKIKLNDKIDEDNELESVEVGSTGG
jgi:hypothetical protein